MKTFCIEIPDDPEKMEEFQKVMNKVNDAMVKDAESIAEEFGISIGQASNIRYLRTRSRWTQEKEDYLIKLAQENKELPNVFAGDF